MPKTDPSPLRWRDSLGRDYRSDSSVTTVRLPCI
jgi:hypothetical protein